MSNLAAVNELGQSVWLNYLRRAFIESGELRTVLNGGISGITSTPKVFEKAITDSSDYDDMLRDLVGRGMPVHDMYQALVVDDIQRAADVLRPIFEISEGIDGYVTVELNPALAHDAVGTIAEARHILALINRANVMVEVPTTGAGIKAIEKLIGDGVNVNATHIFDPDTYQKTAEAYIRGIDSYITTHSVWRQTPASVASISLSRIDTMVDKELERLGREELMGLAGIAIAKEVYRRFREMFTGPTWAKLKDRGAKVQRPKWTRTTPRSFRYPDTYYIEALIGPDTVCTVSASTFNAFCDHGKVGETLTASMDVATRHIDQLSGQGLDFEAIGRKLQEQSLSDFDQYFQNLIHSVTKRREILESGWRRLEVQLGKYQPVVEEALTKFCEDKILCRIWAHDYTVWKQEPEEITNRLGWLHIVETMIENIDELASFAQEAQQDGIEEVVVLGMGGSSLAPELYAQSFGPWIRLMQPGSAHIEATILDTTDPESIDRLAARLNLKRTLFIVASKSGSTVETLSTFRYFYNRVLEIVGKENAGQHFVAITDPGTGLVEIARQFKFRNTFRNDPTIGGRYSALSYFGLVPAALVGVDLAKLLDRAEGMVANANSCNCRPKGDHVAASLGTVLGLLAKAGRDKLTLITSPAITQFGDWVEQLLAESTGKEGTGIVPVVNEPLSFPEIYGDDRLFVHICIEGDDSRASQLETLIKAGFPVITLHLRDIYDLGGLFFTWEMATAIAGYYLGIQPFNQPNVESAKTLAREMVADFFETGILPEGRSTEPSAGSLEQFLNQSMVGDYVAIQAYLPPAPEAEEVLQALRLHIRDRYHLATTCGFGPRYLHSTGQLHKGDRGNGLFIQLLADPQVEVVIPDEAGKPEGSLTFGSLMAAQALGDAKALEQARRRLIRYQLGHDIAGGLSNLMG